MFGMRNKFGRRKAQDDLEEDRVMLDRHSLEIAQFKEVMESFKASRVEDRLKILEIFLSSEKHQTLEELAAILKEKAPELHDRMFLNETMEMFCRFGFAQEIRFDNLETRYEHHHLGMHHDHFICIRCGLIQEFANPDLERLQMQIAREVQFHALQHKMEVYGLCSGCMDRRDPTLPLLMAARGEKVRIVRVLGGKAVQARLASMGLVPDACVQVINNQESGYFIVVVNDSRLALGTEIAQKILVTHSCNLKNDASSA